MWAVGQTEDPGQLTLIEHWNGKAWRQVTSPNPGSNKLNDVSPSWAVGSYNSSGTKTLVLRRVGNSWAWVTSPNPETNLNELQGVVQISPDNGWAAGYVLNGTAYRTLILHWNGTAWKRVQSPNTGDASTDNMLFGIAAHGADDLWAVGQREEGPGTQPLTLHWNGAKWKIASAPTLGDVPFDFFLVDVESTRCTPGRSDPTRSEAR